MNSVTVTEIPPDLLFSESRRPPAPSEERSEILSKPSHTSTSLAQPNPHISNPETRLQLHKFGPGRMVKDFSVSLDPGNAIALSSSMTTDGLQLHVSQIDGSRTDIVQLAALPHWFGSSNSTTELKLPESAGGSATIIIHKTDAKGYGDTQLPLVIERDPKFFSQPQAFLENASRHRTLDSDDGEEGEYSEGEDFGVPKYSALFSPDTQGESSRRGSKRQKFK
jgi:hypothetical protein